MSRVIGIDARDDRVRAVALRVAYRKLELEMTSEELVSEHESEGAAIAACVARLGGLDAHRVDTLVTTLDGQRTFVHRLQIPVAAQRRLDELLPFELEAQLPIEIDDVVFTHVVLPHARGSKAPLQILTASARTSHVRARIEQVESALGRAPDRVGASALELAQLATIYPTLRNGRVLLIDMGSRGTDICLLDGGQVRGARSVDLGTQAFPARAQSLVAQLRQTMSAFLATWGVSLERLVVTGEGVRLAGLRAYLANELGLEVSLLDDAPKLDGLDRERAAELPRFSRALAAGLHGARGHGFDLRQGELAYQRGYSYLKEKAPLLLGMFAGVAISFLFATWARGTALDAEQQLLTQNLEQLTKSTFGESVGDPDEATALLEQAQRNKLEDPMPYLDGFGAAIAIAETLPLDVRHDLEEFDYTRGKLKLRGLVDSTDQVQEFTKALNEHRCIENANVAKISQVVNSERERYSLEADVICPEDPSDPKKKAAAKPAATTEADK